MGLLQLFPAERALSLASCQPCSCLYKSSSGILDSGNFVLKICLALCLLQCPEAGDHFCLLCLCIFCCECRSFHKKPVERIGAMMAKITLGWVASLESCVYAPTWTPRPLVLLLEEKAGCPYCLPLFYKIYLFFSQLSFTK